METPKKHRGALSEMIACAWLLQQGYEVYRNISAHGLADLVAIKEGRILQIDVKTLSAGAPMGLRWQQTAVGVAVIYVRPDGSCILDTAPQAKFALGEQAPCRQCGALFLKRRETHVFCGDKCRTENFNSKS